MSGGKSGGKASGSKSSAQSYVSTGFFLFMNFNFLKKKSNGSIGDLQKQVLHFLSVGCTVY